MSKRSGSKLSLAKGSKHSSSLLRNSKGSRTSKPSIASATEDSYAQQQRDRFARELWSEVFDAAFGEIYASYLDRQSRRLTVHCACEAALKIVAFEFLQCDPGERLRGVDIFELDRAPLGCDGDVLAENGDDGGALRTDLMAMSREPLKKNVADGDGVYDDDYLDDDLINENGELQDIYKNEMF